MVGAVMGVPDFIIAGAMRGGTTALAEAVGEHPEVLMCTPKEPNFFAVPRGALEFRGPGDQGFALQNVRDWPSYQRLFEDAAGRLRGEASATYLTIPGVASEIQKTSPDVKLIFILRDPVERAFSAWQYLRGKGRENLRDFREALTAEESRRCRGYGPIWWYVHASRYHIGLEEYLAHFGRHQLHLLTMEELRRDPAATISAVYRFLGLENPTFRPSALEREINRSGAPRLESLTRVLNPPHRLRVPLSHIAPPALRQLIRKARAASLDAAQAMPAEARSWLRAELAGVGPEVRRLTGLDTNDWQPGHG
jgi:hypothetical protein